MAGTVEASKDHFLVDKKTAYHMYVISSFWYQYVISKTIIIIVARNMQVSLHSNIHNQLLSL